MAHALQDGVVHLRRRFFPRANAFYPFTEKVAILGRSAVDWLLILPYHIYENYNTEVIENTVNNPCHENGSVVGHKPAGR